MTDLAYSRADDRHAMLAAPIDLTPLLRTWHNADADTKGISEVTCSLRDGQLYVRVSSVGPDGPVDWGEVPATPYADLSITGGARADAEPVADGTPTPHYAEVSSTEGGPAFQATYDHGFMRVRMQARMSIGILPLVYFTDFTDDSGRSSYVTREVYVY
jgi:hypothetical protein